MYPTYPTCRYCYIDNSKNTPTSIMFSFGRDTRYRLEGHRHNPYIGSFHSVDRRTIPSSSSMLLDSYLKNPFIGTVRHSPAGNSAGLKGLLWEEEPWKAPVLSQVKLSREKKYSNRHASITLLASIPITRFKHTDAALPVCGICLDAFSDGDELRPLPCSHCFHRACVDEWLLGLKSDERTFTNNCPCCRQDISPGSSVPNVTFSPFTYTADEEDEVSITSSSSAIVGCAIPRESFQRLGEYLSASDIGTSNTLLERFNDEDSNIVSEADSGDLIAVAQETIGMGHTSYCQGHLLDLSSRHRQSNESRISSDLYDIKLSRDEDDHIRWIPSCDSGSNLQERQGAYVNQFDMAENHFSVPAGTIDSNITSDQGEADSEIEDDEECILRASRLSNVSICTATNDANILSERRLNKQALALKLKKENMEDDGEGSVVSDMEEEYFMGYQSGAPVPFNSLGGSLYSDCGVPLKAVLPHKRL